MTISGPARPTGRIAAIDALRGLVMLLMLVDHVREFFFLHAQVRDPMDLAATEPGLFWTRTASHICAPVFVLLTGLSASLYAAKQNTGKHGDRAKASAFMLKRGLILVLLEVTLVNVAWTRSLLPPILYLQVIWAIGISMIALAGLLWLPRAALIGVALAIMLGHNLLTSFALVPGETGYILWTILHQRGFIDLPWGVARTSYPVLPWIGVIAAGYALGPWFVGTMPGPTRRRRLLGLGAAALAGFAILRGLNGYGEPVPWQAGASWDATLRAFLNLTKYPPSADFLLATLGPGLILLAWLEAVPPRRLAWLCTFGGVPLFFYVTHLYALRLLHDGLLWAGLAGSAGRIETPGPGYLWLIAAALSLALYPACRWAVRFKRRSTAPWVSYF
nr:heparan-alpha-glucosaminide N-acetyltransferase domain-containing protein [Methylobacterium sp. OTU13CASTA1]